MGCNSSWLGWTPDDGGLVETGSFVAPSKSLLWLARMSWQNLNLAVIMEARRLFLHEKELLPLSRLLTRPVISLGRSLGSHCELTSQAGKPVTMPWTAFEVSSCVFRRRQVEITGELWKLAASMEFISIVELPTPCVRQLHSTSEGFEASGSALRTPCFLPACRITPRHLSAD